MGVRHVSLVLMVLVSSATVLGEVLDISSQVETLVNAHNQERRSRLLYASNMREMAWDASLARDAELWSSNCLYQRPPREQYDVGSNLFLDYDLVHNDATISRLVNKSLTAWSNSRYFVYGPECRRGCSYVQMINAETSRVGCALTTCMSLQTSRTSYAHASLMVCFYSPRLIHLGSLPFEKGSACSRCPRETFCRSGLCAEPGVPAVPVVYESRNTPVPFDVDIRDELTSTEKYYLKVIHNRLRKEERSLDELNWDDTLERWANHVINCNINFPGPKHAFTNFHRLEQSMDAYRAVYTWQTEGSNTYLQHIHGCRAPVGSARCNHLTNVLQPMTTSMGCATKSCPNYTRQLVCIYDNEVDRTFGRHPAPNRLMASNRHENAQSQDNIWNRFRNRRGGKHDPQAV